MSPNTNPTTKCLDQDHQPMFDNKGHYQERETFLSSSVPIGSLLVEGTIWIQRDKHPLRISLSEAQRGKDHVIWTP